MRSRVFLARALGLAVLLGMLPAPPAAAAPLSFLAPPEGAEMRLELVRRYEFDDFPDVSTGSPQHPMFIAPSDLEFFPDGSGDSLLAHNTGTVAWLAPDFSVRTVFGIPSTNSLASFQQTGEFWDNEGLLGLAFDPDFGVNRYFYVHLNREPAGGIEIWRLTWDPANPAGIWSSGHLVLEIPKPQIASDPIFLHNHDGGNPTFGPDGMLYVLVGDGGIGGANFGDNQAQSPQSFWGKALRVDPTGKTPPQIVARGLRNPFTNAWFGDSLVIADVGADDADSWEEIDLLQDVTAATGEPPNFGWPIYAGPCWTFVADPADCAGLVEPIHGYRKDDAFVAEDPDATPGPPGTVYVTAVIAGPVYQGDRYDGYLDEVLVYADFVQSWVRGALLSEDGRVLADRHLAHYDGLIPIIVRGPDGWIYAVGNDAGHVEILRLTGPDVQPPPDPPVGGPPLVDNPTNPLPRYLSDTGFFPAFPSLAPHPRAVSYTPLFELWSDGAGKRRWLFLPPGTAVDTSDPESWTFPVGTLVVKHFGYELVGGGRREIETRVLQKAPEGWRFGTYVWSADQSEAELSDGRPVSLPVAGVRGALPPSFTYEIPGTSQCRACHARQRDVVIGFEPVQLAPPALRALEDAGVLGTPHDAPWQSVAGADWVEASVRGYLHANCAHCHSAEGGLGATLGFSLDHRATESVVGLASRRGRGPLVDPGNPAGSALLLMLAGSPDLPRMPPLGPQIVDVDAVARVSEWIRSLGDDVPDAQHPAGRDRVEVVELYHPDEDRYLLATAPEEAAALESALGASGWRRTGYGFAAWRRPATTIPGPRAVHRATPGGATIPATIPSSHLAFQKVASRTRPGPPAATTGTSVAFYLYPPEGGACASGLQPVYQASVRRTGSPSLLYRYTTSLSVYRAMQGDGWRGDGVVMCAPR